MNSDEQKKEYKINKFLLKHLKSELKKVHSEIKEKTQKANKIQKQIELLENVIKHKPSSKNKTKKSSPSSIEHDINKRCPKGYLRNKTTKRCQKK
jgi:hypothetical protein